MLYAPILGLTDSCALPLLYGTHGSGQYSTKQQNSSVVELPVSAGTLDAWHRVKHRGARLKLFRSHILRSANAPQLLELGNGLRTMRTRGSLFRA